MLLGAVLLIELIIAVTLLGVAPGRTPQPKVTPHPAPTSVGPAPLVVGDNRVIELIGLGGAVTDALLDRVAADIGGAVEAVEAFWGADWPHHIVLVATGTDEQFRAAAGGVSAQWTDVAAIAVADRVDPPRRFAAGQRIVLAPGAAAMNPEALRVVLAHELFHYAARADTASDAPHWLIEGVADFVARPGIPLSAADGGVPATLPSDAELDTAGRQRSPAYDRAWLFARFIADDYGPAGLRALYLAACGAGHPDVATAVHDVLDTELPGLLIHWERWLTG